MVKRRRTPGTSDRCNPLRQQIARIKSEIDVLDEVLREQDLPPDIRRTFEAQRRQRLRFLESLEQLLTRCVLLPDVRI